MKRLTQITALLLIRCLLFSLLPLTASSVTAAESGPSGGAAEASSRAAAAFCNSDAEAYSPDKCFYTWEDGPGVFMMDYAYYPYETEHREYLTREQTGQIAYLDGMLYFSAEGDRELRRIDLQTRREELLAKTDAPVLRFAAAGTTLYYLSQNEIVSVDLNGGETRTVIRRETLRRFWLADEGTLEYMTDSEDTVFVCDLATGAVTERENSVSELPLEEPSAPSDSRGLSYASLKSKFPNGKYWNHVGGTNNPDGWTSTPCSCHYTGCSYYGSCQCNSFTCSIQCYGYALKVAYDYYGINPVNWRVAYSLNSLKAGDWVRYKNNGHSIWVTAVNGDQITYTDCNATGRCQIRWEGTISRSTLAATLNWVWCAPTATERAYTINVDANGGTSGAAPITLRYGESFSLGADSVSKDGCGLQGWTLHRAVDDKWYVAGVGWCTEAEIQANGYSKRHYTPDLTMTLNASWFTGVDAARAGVFTFCAVWRDAYTVSIDANGGTVNKQPFTAQYGSPFSLSSDYAAKSGCVLQGWNAYRPADGKWFVGNAGWCTQEEIDSRGLTKQLYAPNRSVTLNGSWIANASSGDVDAFTFRAVWTSVCQSGHNYSCSVSKAPTATAAGTLKGSCSRCGAAVTVTLPKLNTSDYSYSVVTKPTCTATGVGRYTWKNTTYGTYRFDAVLAKAAHSFVDDVTPPTCTREGLTVRTCSVCGYAEREAAAALGHAWDSGVVYAAPTRTEEGLKRYACTRCGKTRLELVPDLNGDSVPQLPCEGADCPGDVFTDLPGKTKWAHDAIDWALVYRITSGTSATAFSPTQDCTRAQAVTFLWRAAGCPEPKATSCAFTDVKKTASCYKAVLWAVEEGITNGASQTTFNPGGTCTRAQIVTFLWRAAGCPEPQSAANPFTDVKKTASCYKAVLWAVEEGITNGASETAFSPGGACTRAHVVTFLYRYAAE